MFKQLREWWETPEDRRRKEIKAYRKTIPTDPLERRNPRRVVDVTVTCSHKGPELGQSYTHDRVVGTRLESTEEWLARLEGVAIEREQTAAQPLPPPAPPRLTGTQLEAQRQKEARDRQLREQAEATKRAAEAAAARQLIADRKQALIDKGL